MTSPSGVQGAPDPGRRGAQLVSALGAIRNRVAASAAAAGRDARSITLIAVTKTYPATDVAALAGLGVRDFGESRDQEASSKINDVAALFAAPESAGQPARSAQPSLRWHFVGQLQSRKCRSVAHYASAVHSVDRAELVDLLAEATTRARRAPLEVFVQVSLDGAPGRGGVVADRVPELAERVAVAENLILRGVMAVAPQHADPGRAFATLAEVSARVQADHPDAVAISAGMSADLEPAIENGATHVRVGSALLGRRPDTFG